MAGRSQNQDRPLCDLGLFPTCGYLVVTGDPGAAGIAPACREERGGMAEQPFCPSCQVSSGRPAPGPHWPFPGHQASPSCKGGGEAGHRIGFCQCFSASAPVTFWADQLFVVHCGVEQYPWPPPTSCQECFPSCDNHRCLWKFPEGQIHLQLGNTGLDQLGFIVWAGLTAALNKIRFLLARKRGMTTVSVLGRPWK